MYGEDEFGAAAALEGLGAVPHVQAVMEIDPEAIVTVQAQAVPAAQAIGEPAAQPGDAPLAQGAGDWPKATEIDFTRLQAARAIKDNVIKDGLSNLKLTGWQPANTKPRKAELWWALMERDPTARPKNWGVEKIVQALMAYTGPHPQVTHFLAPVCGTGDVPPPPPPDPGAGAMRWTGTRLLRLLHICVDDDGGMKDKFLARDKKLSRREMDANAQSSFWVEAAAKYNSDHFYHIIQSKAEGEADRYAGLNVNNTGYVATADKLKTEFGTFRTLMSKCRANFAKSGNGDDPDVGLVEQQPDAVFSSEFFNFTQGNIVLDYGYELFLSRHMLEHTTCEMPKGAAFNSSAHTSCAQGPRKRGGNNKKKQGMAKLLHVLQNPKPLKLMKTHSQNVATLVFAQRNSIKVQLGLESLIDKYQSRIAKLAAEQRTILRESGVNKSAALADEVDPERFGSAAQQVKWLQHEMTAINRNLEEARIKIRDVHYPTAADSGLGTPSSAALYSSEDDDEDGEDDEDDGEEEAEEEDE